MNRNTALISIRSALNLATEQSTASEKFQNLTLRPVLKFQNDLLVEVFRQYAVKRKFKLELKSKAEQQTFIQQALSKDQMFKSKILGIILAHFTIEEYMEYIENESEYNRRIITMTIQRLESQLIN